MTTARPANLYTVAILLAHASLAYAETPTYFGLDGPWTLQAVGEAETFSAVVPGTVHTDLLAAGKIPDPFFGANALRLGWIADTAWTYTKTFTPPASLLSRQKLVLKCDGLDTVATVTLNGKRLGRADNMFRRWTFDVTSVIRPGLNTLAVTFTPVKDYVSDFIAAASGTGPNTAYPGSANVRKAAYADGWDFCAKLPACGIYKSVRIVGYDEVRFTGLVVDTRLDASEVGSIVVTPTLSGAAALGTRLVVTVSYAGRPVATADVPAGRAVVVAVDRPHVWWPNGMGDHPLYDLRVDLIDGDGRTIDTAARRTGFRRIELVRPAEGRSMHLNVNGRPIFARGANWVPADMFLTRLTTRRQHQLLQSAADVNMNMIRTWGGGAYEDDAFYDACDELGLLVWQDFKFACRAYPGRNAAFAENVRQEVAEQVARLSPHPSLAVWCGNNEVDAIVTRFGLMSRADYDLLFGDLIGGGLKALLPGAQYVVGSPGEGDEHNWWVWHIGADFEKYRESHGWMTEFGFESFPAPSTVKQFTAPEDRASVLSPVMKAHQNNGNGRGNEMILDQIGRYFRKPKDFESTLRLSQINQAYGLGLGIDHWRSDWPRSGGAMVWQLDDSWPCASWSMVDYFGRWKAAMYAAKARFAPVLITGIFDDKTQTLPLTVCSDDRSSFTAEVQWNVTNSDGQTVERGAAKVDVPSGVTAVAGPTIRLAKAVAKSGARALLVWVDVRRDEKVVASNLLMTARPKAIPRVDPRLQAAVTAAGDGFDVRLSAERPALWAFAEIPDDPDARWSDNFVHVAADRPAVLHVTPSRPIELVTVRRQLVVRSLYDLTDDAVGP